MLLDKENNRERVKNKLKVIEEKKKKNGTRRIKHLKKYSDNFNNIFNFFLKSYIADILSFPGSIVNVKFDISAPDAKFAFRLYDNGQFKNKDIVSCQPNVLRAVIIAKKSFGLFLDQWTDGIDERNFTKEEILSQFYDNNIEIPDSFLKDFENTIKKKRFKRLEKYYETRNNRK
jgi:hypothetical protein